MGAHGASNLSWRCTTTRSRHGRPAGPRRALRTTPSGRILSCRSVALRARLPGGKLLDRLAVADPQRHQHEQREPQVLIVKLVNRLLQRLDTVLALRGLDGVDPVDALIERLRDFGVDVLVAHLGVDDAIAVPVEQPRANAWRAERTRVAGGVSVAVVSSAVSVALRMAPCSATAGWPVAKDRRSPGARTSGLVAVRMCASLGSPPARRTASGRRCGDLSTSGASSQDRCRPASAAVSSVSRLYEEGPAVNLRSVVAVSPALVARGLERRSCLYGLLGGRIRRNRMVRSRTQFQKGRSGRQTKSGASGSELLLAGKHVPDGVGEAAGDVDLGH